VRNGDAATHAGRAEFLALLQCLQHRALALAGQLRGLGSELLQDLLFAVDLQRRNDRIGRDEIGEQHGPFPENWERSGEISSDRASQRRRTISTRSCPVNGAPSLTL
jgi:hypothetical protein